MPIVPTPPLAKDSTTYEPTPPKPNTKTFDLFNLSIPSFFINRILLSNLQRLLLYSSKA